MKMNWNTLLCEKRRREHSSKESTDLRSEFQKDYHRIIQSASFRRLQDKTQVFPLDKSDFVRTRLTHSLEVSSFAKSLGHMILQNLMAHGRKDITSEVESNACSVLECAGLIHDIGNPSFGHFGEDYIREWFRANLPKIKFKGQEIDKLLTPQMAGDFYHFEGNAQALRLLTKLHFLVDENGMNLNYTLLNTIIKYPVSSVEIDKDSGDIRTKKMGYYYAEQDIFKEITKSTGAVGCRHPLAFILEAADDIAYKTADIEDAAKKGFITYQQLLDELKSERYCGKCADDGERAEYDKAVGKLESYLTYAKDGGISSPEKNAVQRWVIYVQGVLLRCAAFGFTSSYDMIMNGTFGKEILAVSRGNALAYALGDIACRYVFKSIPIYKLEISASVIFEFLLDRFVNAAVKFDSDEPATAIEKRMISLVSDNYIRIYRYYSEGKDDIEKLYLRLLLATDFICGMTDSYAQRLYRELNGMV